MKIGVISDLHGNIVALNNVLKELKKQNIEKIICCGDIIGIGPYPEETVQRLMEIKEKLIIVRGNHEQYLLKGIPLDVHDEKRKMKQIEVMFHKWTHSRLSKESIAFLEKLPSEQYVKIEGKKIYIVHYPMYNDLNYKKHIQKPNLEEVQELFKKKEADIFFYGHTHIANIGQTENKLFINPGSLGCPGGSNIARYGILNIENGKVLYNQLQMEYDVQEIKENIKNLAYPLYKKVLMLFYGDNEQIVQLLGETANVRNIMHTNIQYIGLGKVTFNCDQIDAYVIGYKNQKQFIGTVYGAIILEDGERLIVADKNIKLDYAAIKGYFKNDDSLKNAKFKCLYEKSAGAIVYKIVKGEPRFLIIYSKKDLAGFPKGHVEYGETEEAAAKREIFEEVGINVELKKGFKETISYLIEDTPINKEVVFFLAEINNNTKINIDENEINKYKFMTYNEAKKVLRDQTKDVLKKVLKQGGYDGKH